MQIWNFQNSLFSVAGITNKLNQKFSFGSLAHNKFQIFISKRTSLPEEGDLANADASVAFCL